MRSAYLTMFSCFSANCAYRSAKLLGTISAALSSKNRLAHPNSRMRYRHKALSLLMEPATEIKYKCYRAVPAVQHAACHHFVLTRTTGGRAYESPIRKGCGNPTSDHSRSRRPFSQTGSSFHEPRSSY